MFIFKFIAPYVSKLQRVRVNHETGLFIMGKKAYIELTQLREDMAEKRNIFMMKKFFQEFSSSLPYKNFLYHLKTDI